MGDCTDLITVDSLDRSRASSKGKASRYNKEQPGIALFGAAKSFNNKRRLVLFPYFSLARGTN